MIYAIGDIHGSMTELKALRNQIMKHAANIPEPHTVVCLGDYIDRGENSKHVVQFLARKPFTNFQHIYLLGNHEEMARDVYKLEYRFGTWVDVWLNNGGETTLYDYGLTRDDLGDHDKDPEDLLNFINSLQRHWRKGKFFFVHAGVQPLRKLKNQTGENLRWIRRPFLEYTGDWEDVFDTARMTVVHGHTPITYDPQKGVSDRSNVPLILGNRINLDTGAVASGKLGCVMFDNEGQTIKGTL